AGTGENYLRVAVESAGIGVWQMDLQTGAIRCSSTSARLFDVPVETLAFYDDILGLVLPEDRERFSTEVDRCIKEHGEYEIDYRVLRPNGTMCWIRQRGKVEWNGESAPTRMLGVMLEVSQQKEVESKVIAREEHLRSIL